MKGKKTIPFENGIRFEMGEQRSQAKEVYYLKILIGEVEASSPKIPVYYVNTNEIPGELLRENLISSHVKITC